MGVTVRRREVRDKSGKIAGVLEIARTKGWHAEGSAADAKARLLLEQLPGVLWTTDRNLRITSNWGAELGDAGIKPRELVGQTVHEYLKCQDPHAAPIAQHDQALNGATSHFEYRHKTRDFEIHLGPLHSTSRETVGCIDARHGVTDR